jgi:hypothetical protein
MKRTILFSVMLALAALPWAGSQATSQTEHQRGSSSSQDSTTEFVPQIYLGKGPRHKVFVSGEDSSLYNDLLSRDAIRREVDYGSFKMVIVDEQAIGGRSALLDYRNQVRDEQDLIPINGYILDTTDSELTLNKVPVDLRQTEMAGAIAKKRVPSRGGLYIVQFAGPIKDEWLEQLRGTGAEIVTYIPHNAYVVHAGQGEAMALAQFRSAEFVQFVGDYEPAFRLSPALQALRAEGLNALDELIDITVQVIDGADAAATIQQLKGLAVEFISEHQVLNYRNVALKVRVARLGEIASMENVFVVEERGQRSRLDERQGQILAGQFTMFDTPPSGPGYLTFLANKGLNSTSSSFFAVNVVDDAYSLTGASGHPDLPLSRVAFQNNPTDQSGAQGGHGFLNAHIVGGFNNGTGSAFEDEKGFNYGLGIAPWVRVGVTAIFGPNKNTSPSEWESKAYGQGARISSNSWKGLDNFKYGSESQEYDAIVRDARSGTAGNQQMIVVFAAGNFGQFQGQPVNSTVSSPGTAKNVITVGASENVRPTAPDGCGHDSSDANSAGDMADFSSRGPVNPSGGDGRVKPDIVAPGTHITAGVPQANYDGSSMCNLNYFPTGQTRYSLSSGTSHSCPAVAGGAALLYQDFLNKTGIHVPSPAMAKAYLMNSATYMPGLPGSGAGGNLPSNAQGMGRMNLGRAFDGAKRIVEDQKKVLGATGNTYQASGVISDPTKPFRVTLAWTDAPGPTTGAPYVNNLDLEVKVNGITYKGNVFSGELSTAGGSFDAKNNVESVYLPTGTSGNFTVTVRAANIAGDGVPGNSDTTDQDFALVIYNGERKIIVNPTSLTFIATEGAPNLPSKPLTITNVDGTPINWTAGDDVIWMNVYPTEGSPSTASVFVFNTNAAVGTHHATITIGEMGSTNTAPVTVPVTLIVTEKPDPPIISVNPTSLSFTATAGAANPIAQSLYIKNIGGGVLNWNASNNATWLSVNPASGGGGTAPSTALVSVNISGLAPGTYHDTITISEGIVSDEGLISSPGSVAVTPVTVHVTLTVSLRSPTP